MYGAGDVATRALALLTVPVYVHEFAPEVYSGVALTTATAGLLASVLLLGGETVLSRFWFLARTKDEQADLAVTWIGFVLALSSIVAGLLLPLAGPVARSVLDRPDVAVLLLLALVDLPLAQASRMLATVLRNDLRSAAFACTGLTVGVVSVGIGLLLVLRGAGTAGIFWGVLVGDAVGLVLRGWLVRGRLHGRPRQSLLPPLLRYGVPLAGVSACFWVFTLSDRLVLGRLGSAVDLGLFSLASSVTAGVAVLGAALAQAWTPRGFAAFASRPHEAPAIAGRALTVAAAASGSVAVALAVFAEEAVSLVAPAAYADASALVPALAVALAASAVSPFTGTALAVTGRTGLAARYAAYAAATNLVLAVALVPALGGLGAATASAAGYAVLSASYLWRGQRLLPVEVDRIALLVLSAGLVLVAALACSPDVQSSPFKALLLVAYALAAAAASARALRRAG